MTDPEAPVGLFDSGVGGLTVVRELLWRLPAESLCYVADTAHVPYGGRPPHEILSFALGISRWLIARGCKLIVMACNTSSATALDIVRREATVPVVGVIEGGARVATRRAGAVVGVAATAATVASGAYPAALTALDPSVEVYQVACPQFVPLVEAGRLGTPDAYAAVCESLDPLPLARLDALVLGCTHYPFLAPLIRMKAEERTLLVDPAFETARTVARILEERGLQASGPPRHRLYATGPTASLERINRACFAGRLPACQPLEPQVAPITGGAIPGTLAAAPPAPRS